VSDCRQHRVPCQFGRDQSWRCETQLALDFARRHGEEHITIEDGVKEADRPCHAAVNLPPKLDERFVAKLLVNRQPPVYIQTLENFAPDIALIGFGETNRFVKGIGRDHIAGIDVNIARTQHFQAL